MALLLNDLIYDDMTSPLPLLICTWFLKNQVWKIKLNVIYFSKSRLSSLKLWKFSLFDTCCIRQKFLIQTIQSETIKEIKNGRIFFLCWRLFFLVSKPSLFYHWTFVKIGFHDKVTGFLVFEEQMTLPKVPMTSYHIVASRSMSRLVSSDTPCY